MLWLLCANLLLVALTLTHIVDIDRQLRKKITMTAQDTVNAVVAQLGKAKAELLEKIADLQLQLDDAKVADVVDLSELVAVAQALDDIVPDAEEPADEQAEDEAVEVDEPAEEQPPF